jgi:hypothetical protein
MHGVTVTLPEKATGAQILKAFAEASTFSETSDCKWIAWEYKAGNGDANERSTYTPREGVIATPAYFQSPNVVQRFLFGQKEGAWETREGLDSTFLTQIRMAAIAPDQEYSFVKLFLHHEYDPDPAGGFKVANTPDDKAFAPFRPAYDRIVGEFVRLLEERCGRQERDTCRERG